MPFLLPAAREFQVQRCIFSVAVHVGDRDQVMAFQIGSLQGKIRFADAIPMLETPREVSFHSSGNPSRAVKLSI